MRTTRIMGILCIHRCRRAHYLWMSAAVGMALAAALACRVPRNGAAITPVTTQSRAGTGAPAGADVIAGIEWVRVAAPGGELSAAVARPPGKGPFPVIVILHGTDGFAREYVRLAYDLARMSGVVTVAGCWFSGSQGEGRQFVTSIECQGAPAMPGAASDAALDSVGALVAAAQRPSGSAPRPRRPLRAFARRRRCASLRMQAGRRADRRAQLDGVPSVCG